MAYNTPTVSPLVEPAGTAGAGINKVASSVADAVAGPTYGAGWEFANNGRTFIMLVNKNTQAAKIVFLTSKLVAGLAVDDVVPGAANLPGSATNGGIGVFGPFDPDLFGQTMQVAFADDGGGAVGVDAYVYTL